MQLDVIKMDEISQEYALFSHKNYAKLNMQYVWVLICIHKHVFLSFVSVKTSVDFLYAETKTKTMAPCFSK